jgi:hypothetical protein
MSQSAALHLRLPTSCWTSSEMLDALAVRDIGHVFRTVQRLTGASQTQIGVATGLSQAQVSEIIGRKRQVATIDVVARIVIGLDIPEPARTVLLLGDRARASDAAATAAPPVPVPAHRTEAPRPDPDRGEYGDVTAVYASRSEFMSKMPPHGLLEGAAQVRAAGLSLNMICQNYADNRLIDLIGRGTYMRLLFLDPDGEAIRTREREEGYPLGHLSVLTDLNIQNILRRVRDRLEPAARANLAVATYDETVRFNLLLLDSDLCIAQPYLPELRGVDSPTLVVRPRGGSDGLYATFDSLFERLWLRAKPR